MKKQHLEEADWKHLQKITPDCRERYLAWVNSSLSTMLSAGGGDTDTRTVLEGG